MDSLCTIEFPKENNSNHGHYNDHHHNQHDLDGPLCCTLYVCVIQLMFAFATFNAITHPNSMMMMMMVMLLHNMQTGGPVIWMNHVSLLSCSLVILMFEHANKLPPFKYKCANACCRCPCCCFRFSCSTVANNS